MQTALHFVPVDKTRFVDLEPGTVLHWGGNNGYSARDYCILERVQDSRGGIGYQCYDLDHPERNEYLRHVESWSIVLADDPGLWHGQHFYLTEERHDLAKVEAYRVEHLRQSNAKREREAAAKAEGDRLEALGRELWPRLIGKCAAVIIARHEKNTSDGMTDYYGSVTTETVILAPSQHTRDLFSEMRKAAALLPETAHLGPGCGRFTPYVEIGQDFQSNGSCYYKGSRSHWHSELDRDEHYNNPEFTTRAEAEAYIAAKGEPEPISFDGQVIPFGWNIAEEDIENREKYSMGAGYYLGHHRYSGWQVSKVSIGQNGPTREEYICLARRHDHLTKASPKAETVSPQTASADGYTVKHERDWTWLHFPGKPAEATREALKAEGARFSGKRVAWYFTRHLEESEIAAIIGAPNQDAPAQAEASAPEPKAPQPPQADPIPAKFRALAEKLTDTIAEKRRPMTQNYTPKRQAEYMSRLADADHLERTQRALLAIADARETGTLPDVLVKLTSKAAIHDLLYTRFANHGYYDVVDTGEFTDKTPEGLALHALIGGDSEESKRRREEKLLAQKAKELIGQVPGYFPTPREIVEHMCDIAGVEPGLDVLEPSAGSGDTAIVIRERGANVDTIEINYTLCEILKSKGFEARQGDFLDVSPDDKQYDVVIMNPPFENKQDVTHVQHAFKFLKEGGTLVSVMSEGTFFRANCADFREWLSEHGYDEELPEGAFKESGTNVKTRLVVLHK